MQVKILGFRGEKRLTDEQKKTVQLLLEKYGKNSILHCGLNSSEGDDDVSYMSKKLGMRIIGHVSSKDNINMYALETAFFRGDICSGLWFPVEKPTIGVDIVDCCQTLIVTPKNDKERDSGVWKDVQYAVQVRKEVIAVWPDGSYETIVTLPLNVSREVKNKTKPYLQSSLGI